jgi:hypothetical protein
MSKQKEYPARLSQDHLAPPTNTSDVGRPCEDPQGRLTRCRLWARRCGGRWRSSLRSGRGILAGARWCCRDSRRRAVCCWAMPRMPSPPPSARASILLSRRVLLSSLLLRRLGINFSRRLLHVSIHRRLFCGMHPCWNEWRRRGLNINHYGAAHDWSHCLLSTKFSCRDRDQGSPCRQTGKHRELRQEMKRLFCVQDCAVLGDIVAAAPDDLDYALERYERQRKPDAHALGTMDHQVWKNRPLLASQFSAKLFQHQIPTIIPAAVNTIEAKCARERHERLWRHFG